MSTRRLVLTALLAAACGNPMPVEPPPMPPVQPKGAVKSSPAQEAVQPLTNADGFQPLSLNRAVRAGTKAGEKTQVQLPVPASAQAAFVALRARGTANVSVGGQTVAVGDGVPSALVLAPLKAGKLELTADAEVELTVRASGYLEQSGAGLTVAAEPATELKLKAGSTPLSFTAASASEPDDTWGRWLEVRATATAGDARLELRSCGNEDALEVVNVPAGQTRSTLVLAPRGDFCAYSSDALDVQLRVLARHRRFDKTSMRVVAPLAVLDTAAAVGFSGAALPGQKLELDLSQLKGLGEAKAALLELEGAQPLAGPCDQALSPAGALVLHDLNRPLCVGAANGGQLRAELVALVQAGDAVPSSCPALPALSDCAATDLLGRLNCLPGVTATRRAPPMNDPTAEQYLLQVRQPVDHARPDGETFEQQVLFTYAGVGAPVVVHTTGYTLFSYRSDLGRHLNASELEVEHRFFGTSTPASLDYTKLDIVQSAHDSHRLVELLKPLLGGKWLSTGHSKGGMTALFHRRFFPCDTDGSVPYVTPVSRSLDDPRYGAFLQTIGGPAYAECRQVFRELDRGLISNRQAYAAQLRGTYSKIGGAENALWSITGMTSWPLFQYGEVDDPDQGCPAYEALAASPPDFAQLVAYYAASGEGYSDQSFAQAAGGELFGYTYQTTNELGTQGASRQHLSDLAPVPALPETARLSLGAVKVPDFEPRAMRDIEEWLSAHGSRFLFVYGEMDPWTGGQLSLGGAVDSMKLFAPRTNHGAGLDDLTAVDKVAAQTTLQRWVGSTSPRPLGGPRSRGALEVQPQFKDVMRRLGL